MLSKINPLYDIPQRLAAVTIEKEFEGYMRHEDMDFYNIFLSSAARLINAHKNDEDLKPRLADIGAIALRWLSDLYGKEYGKEDK